METLKNNLIPAAVVIGVLVIVVLFGSYMAHHAGQINWKN